MENQATTDRPATRGRPEGLWNARVQHCAAGAERRHSHLIYDDVSSRKAPVLSVYATLTGSCRVVSVTPASTTRSMKRGFTLMKSNTCRPLGSLQI